MQRPRVKARPRNKKVDANRQLRRTQGEAIAKVRRRYLADADSKSAADPARSPKPPRQLNVLSVLLYGTAQNRGNPAAKLGRRDHLDVGTVLEDVHQQFLGGRVGNRQFVAAVGQEA